MLRNASSRNTAVETGRRPGLNRQAVLRGVGAMAIGLGLAACEDPYATQDKVYLPESTPRLSASEQREAQLRTGVYADDIPEYTGAPGPHGEHPAYVRATRSTVFRGEYTTTVPGQETATAAEVRAATTASVSTSVTEVEIEQVNDGRSYVVLKEAR